MLYFDLQDVADWMSQFYNNLYECTRGLRSNVHNHHQRYHGYWRVLRRMHHPNTRSPTARWSSVLQHIRSWLARSVQTFFTPETDVLSVSTCMCVICVCYMWMYVCVHEFRGGFLDCNCKLKFMNTLMEYDANVRCQKSKNILPIAIFQ